MCITILDSVADVRRLDQSRPCDGSVCRFALRLDEILEFFQAIADSTTGGTVIAGIFIAQGDTVVALGSYTATVRNTGAEIDTPVAHIFTVRDGKVSGGRASSDAPS